MRPMFAIAASATVISHLLFGSSAPAQESLSVEVRAEAPPEQLDESIRKVLRSEGLRIQKGEGEPVIDLWLVDSLPAKGEIAEPARSILLPYLEAGRLVGAMRISEELGDYKDHSILPGVYTMRYGLQPVDGDHLGVSNYRDYLLLSFADEDIDPAPITQDDLQALSTGPSGTNHPAVFLLLPVPEGTETPAIVRDEKQDRTGVAVTLPVAVPGKAGSQEVPTTIVIEGAGPH